MTMRSVTIDYKDGGASVGVHLRETDALMAHLSVMASVVERMTAAREGKMVYGAVTSVEYSAARACYLAAAHYAQRLVNDEETAAIVAARSKKRGRDDAR